MILRSQSRTVEYRSIRQFVRTKDVRPEHQHYDVWCSNIRNSLCRLGAEMTRKYTGDEKHFVYKLLCKQGRTSIRKNEVSDKIPVAGKWCRAQMFGEVFSCMAAINGSTGSCYIAKDIY